MHKVVAGPVLEACLLGLAGVGGLHMGGQMDGWVCPGHVLDGGTGIVRGVHSRVGHEEAPYCVEH